MHVSSSVPPACRQQPIVAYLAARFTYWDAARWRALIAAGRVSLNGIPAHADSQVAAGDVVACDLPDPEPPPPRDIKILHADDSLLAVNKPGGLRIHGHGRFIVDNLIYHLRHLHTPPYPDATLVHRLDAGTSGVVLLARGAAAARALGQQFNDRTVDKRYIAVVHGVPADAAGEIALPLGRDRASRLRHRQAVRTEDGKTAVTRYRLLRPLGRHHALLALQPHTGRTHQLRVHLAAVGHPIVGDALYTMDDDAFLAWCQHQTPTTDMHGMTRQALHCRHLSGIHPASQQPITFTAPLPPDFVQLISRLEQVADGT